MLNAHLTDQKVHLENVKRITIPGGMQAIADRQDEHMDVLSKS